MYLLFLVGSVIAYGFTIKKENCVDPDRFVVSEDPFAFYDRQYSKSRTHVGGNMR